MNPPKRIYLDLGNVPSCNFGALWYADPVPEGVAYVLESELNRELAEKDEEIARLNAALETVAEKVQFYTSHHVRAGGAEVI